VARVGTTGIAKTTVEHWATVMAGGRATVQDHALRQRALSFLATAEWTRGEARELGVKATDAEAENQLQQVSYDQREGIPYEGLPKQGEMPALFASRAANHADRLWLIKLALLTTRVEQQQFAQAERQVIPVQIASYYAAHKRQFIVPERRDMEWIVTYSAASISKAVHEIRSGKSFVSVARRVSLDPPTMKGMELATEPERDLARHVFAAKPHVITGPFLRVRNHYVLEVTRVEPARQQSLAESEAVIRQRLATQVLSRLPVAFERKWAARTSCRQGYAVSQCGRSVSA
jgi:hypothetical protein